MTPANVAEPLLMRVDGASSRLDTRGPLAELVGEDALGRPARVIVRAGAPRLRAALPPAARDESKLEAIGALVDNLNRKLAARYHGAKKRNEYTSVETAAIEARSRDGQPSIVREFRVLGDQLDLTFVHPHHVAWAAARLRAALDPNGAWVAPEELDALWGADARPPDLALEPLGEARYERAALRAAGGARVGDWILVRKPLGAAEPLEVPPDALARADAPTRKRRRGEPPARAPEAPDPPISSTRVRFRRGVSSATLIAGADAAWAVGTPDAIEALLRARASRWRAAAVRVAPDAPRARGAYHHGACDVAAALPADWRREPEAGAGAGGASGSGGAAVPREEEEAPPEPPPKGA